LGGIVTGAGEESEVKKNGLQGVDWRCLEGMRGRLEMFGRSEG